MNASVYHLQLNVRDAAASIPFYRAVLGSFVNHVAFRVEVVHIP